MAIAKSTQFANRYGLDLKIYDGADTSMSTALVTVDFANSISLDVSGDRSWATGGQGHINKIGFNNPLQGTLTMSTQIMTTELLRLMACDVDSVDAGTVIFQNDPQAAAKYYIIKATTVWQDAEGNVYDETMTFHKVSPRRAYNISYSGDGDPTSLDIEFDVLENANHEVLTINKADSVG